MTACAPLDISIADQACSAMSFPRRVPRAFSRKTIPAFPPPRIVFPRMSGLAAIPRTETHGPPWLRISHARKRSRPRSMAIPASPYLTAEVHDGAFGVDVLPGIVPKRGHTGEVRRELDMLILREHEEGALRPEGTQEEPELQQDIVPRDRVRLGTGYNGIVGEE